MRKRHIALSDLRISKKAKKYVLQALDSNRLSYGPLTQQFEKSFAKCDSGRYAHCIQSYISATQGVKQP